MLAFNRLTSTYLLPVPEQNNNNIYNENAFIDFEATTAANNSTAVRPAADDQQFDNSTRSINNSAADFDIAAGIDHPANQTASSQLDWRYSLMFVIDFQVILFNALIIAHLLKAKSFQKSSSARYFVLSLAVSDVLVGILVMPLGIVSLISNTWLFGKLWCGKCV